MSEKDFAKKLGLIIKALRVACKMSQQEFANKMDVKQSKVSRWESGESVIDAYKLFRLARFLFDYILVDIFKSLL